MGGGGGTENLNVILAIDLTTTYLSLVSSTVSIQCDTDPVRVVVLQSKPYASTQGHLSCEQEAYFTGKYLVHSCKGARGDRT